MSVYVTVELKEDTKEFLDKLCKWATDNSIEFQGDTEKGYAKGWGFHAEYIVDGDQYTLTVKKKPLLVTWSMVEDGLKKIAEA